ncbi:expressed unknown protein [Seminavis robusta]|uniref:Uncharacterized protein n=1 Tax=Seminavis robusta TaxID=568900 RepID=A0A9N8DRK5_9STRA|nr:expressed unknown protein [Seminavis robusta]|eukprot:Sro231_g093750.1 n/a (335) ;mRNA; r:84798-85802
MKLVSSSSTLFLVVASAAIILLARAQDENVTDPDIILTVPPLDSNVTVAPVASGPPTPRPTLAPTCAVNTDCPGGQFCSSSSGNCELISCINWSAGTPRDETSFSEEPCIADGAEEGTAFCGWDGSCYSYSCENWYQFGPVEFTSFDINNPVPLACELYSTGAEENANSVVFGCRPYQPGSKAPETATWTHFFNQKCSSRPRGNDTFTCYQNTPSTDYTDFLAEVSNLNQQSCNRDFYDNEQPLYWYILQVQQDRKGAVIKHNHGRQNTASSASFDASAAVTTLFAQLISSDDPPPQPVPIPTDAPQESDGALPSCDTVLWAVVAVAAGVVWFL